MNSDEKNLFSGTENSETEQSNLEQSNLAIQKVIEKAITDESFKQRLLENPDETLADYDISEIGKIMIKTLTKEDLERLTPENIEEYFAADSAIYTPDFDKDLPIEYSDEEDI